MSKHKHANQITIFVFGVDWKRVLHEFSSRSVTYQLSRYDLSIKPYSELNSIDCRYIAPISRYPKEEEVLFLPYSHFKVLEDPANER